MLLILPIGGCLLACTTCGWLVVAWQHIPRGQVQVPGYHFWVTPWNFIYKNFDKFVGIIGTDILNDLNAVYAPAVVHTWLSCAQCAAVLFTSLKPCRSTRSFLWLLDGRVRSEDFPGCLVRWKAASPVPGSRAACLAYWGPPPGLHCPRLHHHLVLTRGFSNEVNENDRRSSGQSYLMGFT